MANCYIIRRKHTGSEPPVSIVSWQNGTDAEIVAMVEAANAGKIKLSDYWNVGDKRTVHLSAMSNTYVQESHSEQDVYFTLMHKGLYKDVNDKYVNFVVGMENTLATNGKMNTVNTNSGSWHECPRRTWCNNTFYYAIPSTIRSIFKQFKTKTCKEYDSSEIKTSIDYFSFFAEKEVMGDISNYGCNSTEVNALTQIDFYSVAANRKKSRGTTTGKVGWWNRSPSRYEDNRFCYIVSNGTNNRAAATSLLYISPFGCI